MSNFFSKATTGKKIFINVVEEREKVEDLDKLSKVLEDLQQELKGTNVGIEAYLGQDGQPIIELKFPGL